MTSKWPKKELLIRLALSAILLLFLLGLVNALFNYLRPNTLQAELADEVYRGQVEIYINTDEGFTGEALKAGQASDELMGEVNALSILFTETPVGIKSISMERYFGRLDYFMPLHYKTWRAEEILQDFHYTGSSDQYWLEEGVLYLNEVQPLAYSGDFKRVYFQIDSNLALYKYSLYILAVLFAGLFFYLSGLIINNWQLIKPNFIKQGSLFYYNNFLPALMIFSLVLAVLMPVGFLKTPFILAAIISGVAAVHLNREKIAEPGLINFKPKNVTIILITAVLIGTVIFSYKVGEHDLREDEFQVVDAAAGYYYTGDYYSWDFIEDEPGENYLGVSYYDRAYPHTFLIGLAYRLFGISEWSSRLVSVICGILFIPLLFFVARFFTGDQALALLAAFLAIFNETFIFIFRYTRMYVLLIPLFLILAVLAYKGLTGTSLQEKSNSKPLKLAYKYLNFNYYYALAALAVLYLTYQVHINVLVIGPAFILFVLGMFLLTRANKYKSLLLISIIIAAIALYFDLPGRYSGYIAFLERLNFSYLESTLGYPFPWEVGFTLFFVGFYAIFYLKNSIKHKLLYLYAIVSFALFFFMFLTDRYHHFLYASHVRPLAIILILFACFLLLKAFKNKALNYGFIILVAVTIGSGFYQDIDRHYGDNHRYGEHSAAYQVIVEKYDPKREVIFGQYLRDYYLQGLQDREVKRINMLNHERYSFNQFINDLQQHEAGWITWETRKGRHLEQAIIDYIDYNFTKLHGEGVDDTKVEVYYFDHNAPPDTERSD